MLSQHLVERFVAELVGDDAGGVGYLLKHRVADLGYFIDAVRTVARGGTALDPEVVARMLGRKRRADPLDALTPREREVLQLMAEGLSNQGIADRLTVGPPAVEKHVTSIFSKLDLGHDRSGVAARAGRAHAAALGNVARSVVPGPSASSKTAAEHGDAVLQPAQPRSARRVGAAAPVVGDHDPQRVAGAGDRHVHAVRVGVLDRVGQRLGDEEVGGGLDLRREALLARRRSETGSGAPAVSSSSAAPRPRSVRTSGWMPAASSRRSSIAWRASAAARASAASARSGAAPRLLDPHQRPHQPLLRAVVQVAADPAPLGVGGGDDPRARGRDLVRLQALGEVAEDHDGAAPVRRLHRRGGVADGQQAAVAAHEPVELDAHRLAGRARRQQRALVLRERRSVGAPRVDRRVARPPEQLGLGPVAEQRDGGRVGEAHVARGPDEVDGVGEAGQQRVEELRSVGKPDGHAARRARS